MKTKTIIYLLALALAALTGCQGNPVNQAKKAQSAVTPLMLKQRMLTVLSNAAESDDPEMRCHSLETMAEFGSLGVHKIIRQGLYDPVPAVRFVGAMCIGDIKDHSSRPLLERMTKDKNTMVKLAAGYALEKLGDRRFGQWFDEALFSDDEKFAGQACMLLGKLGNTPWRKDSKNKLWQVLRKKNQHPGVRLQAAEALANLGDEKIVPKLLSFACSGWVSDRIIAISALQNLPNSPDAHAMLTVLAEDEQMEVRLVAIRALGTSAEESDVLIARSAMKQASQTDEPLAAQRIRGLAVLALGAAAKPQDIGILYKALADRSKYLQIAAARAAVDYLKNIPKTVLIPKNKKTS